jgi:hypothetical protein
LLFRISRLKKHEKLSKIGRITRNKNMQKMRIFNKFGLAEYIEWDYDPDKNPIAKEKAYKRLAELKIIAYVYEVAPRLFWYNTTGIYEDINCELY